MKSGIYQILNKTTGKFYIGSATDFDKRWGFHKWVLKNNVHTNSYLQKAWNKYSEQDFDFIILEFCEKEKLSEREQYWLDNTSCYNPQIGYNILKVAHSPIGAKRSAQARANMSTAQRGKFMPPEGVYRMRAAKRNIEKWPHINGSRCKCHECNYKRSERCLIWLKAKKLKESSQNV